MTTSSIRAAVRRRWPTEAARADDGFTLIELLIVSVVVPIILGSLALMLLLLFQNQAVVSNRLSDSNDSQVVSASYVPDVQSASMVTTQNGSTPQCGSTGTQLLGLQWSNNGVVTNVVSYYKVPTTSSPTSADTLYRAVCSSTNGVLSQLSVTPLAFDIPTTQTGAVVSCVTGAASCNYATGWITTTKVAAININFTTPKGAQAFNLTATPRDSTATAGGGIGVSPFVIFGAGCSSPALSVTGGASVSVGGGTGTMTVDSSCSGSLSFSRGPSLNVGSVNTGSPSLNSYIGSGGSPATGPPETYVPAQGNPFSLYPAPPNPTTNLTGACSAAPITCTAGEYATTPSFSNTAVATFGSGTGGVFIFDQPVTFSNSMVMTFTAGRYWFKGGLYITGNAKVSLGAGVYSFGNSAGNTCPSNGCLVIDHGGALTSGTNPVLLYGEAGLMSFTGNGALSLVGSPSYAGIAIWDAAANGTNYPFTLGNSGSATSSLGGVYVPNGEVIVTGSSPVAMSFLVTQTAALSGSGSFVLG